MRSFGPSSPQARVLFMYWGRRGALSRFTLDLAEAAQRLPEIDTTISISRNNELFEKIQSTTSHILPIDTFNTWPGAFLRIDRIFKLRKLIAQEVAQRQITDVIALMPHIWNPLVTGVLRSIGCRYAVVVHDALPHPGDPTAHLNKWLLSDVKNSDVIITLSEAVAGRLSATGIIGWRKLFTLFHPDLNYGPPLSPSYPSDNSPFRVLFFGRILPYKGLPLLVDAIEMLHEDGFNIELGVLGEGDLRVVAGRLSALNAEVRNYWIPDEEVRNLFKGYHAVVLSHTEASQSGVIAAAHGLGLPVIVTPVGGLTEQTIDASTGIVASHADAPSLARAIKRLYESPGLYEHICDTITKTHEERSMRRFIIDLVSHVRYAGSSPTMTL